MNNDKIEIKVRPKFYYYLNFLKDKLKKIIRPIEDILDLPKMLIDSIGIKKFRNGGKIKNDQILGYENFHKDDFIQLFSVAEELIGIGIAIIDSVSLREKNSVEVIQPKKVI